PSSSHSRPNGPGPTAAWEPPTTGRRVVVVRLGVEGWLVPRPARGRRSPGWAPPVTKLVLTAPGAGLRRGLGWGRRLSGALRLARGRRPLGALLKRLGEARADGGKDHQARDPPPRRARRAPMALESGRAGDEARPGGSIRCDGLPGLPLACHTGLPPGTAF